MRKNVRLLGETVVDQKIIRNCRQKLLTAKADLLNRYQSHFSDLRERESGGDEADQTMSILAEIAIANFNISRGNARLILPIVIVISWSIAISVDSPAPAPVAIILIDSITRNGAVLQDHRLH